MRWPESLLLVVGVVAGLEPGHAQNDPGPSAQIHLLATTAADPVFGAGLGAAWMATGRVALAGTATIGRQAGTLGGRFEGFLTYQVRSGPRSRLRGYGGGGIAVERFARAREYLLVVVGVEAARGPRGWFAELGLGGGVRVGVGLRFRP